MRRVIVLGSTGSIGTQALDVIGRSDELEVVGLAAQSSFEPLLEQAREHRVPRVALADETAAARASEAWTAGEVLGGPEGLLQLVVETDCDLVLNALVGSAGLAPTVAILGEGIDVALANKESLVVGGELVTALSEATGAHVIPVDSEHAALHQLVAGERPGTVDRLVLTASGGPFRGRTRDELAEVTREQALAHPTWDMGGKITIDSATLMNKGLELIEAHHLFGVPYEQIDVVVHPQSIVHALVNLNDGSSLAHLGYPDMRVPISYALHYPERADVPVDTLDLVGARQPHVRGARPRHVRVPAPGSRGGRRRRHRPVRDERGERDRGGGVPRRPPAVPRHSRGDRARSGSGGGAAGAALLRPREGRHGGPRDRARAGAGGGRVSWLLAFAGFCVLIILHEARALRRREVGGHARGALLALLPAVDRP